MVGNSNTIQSSASGMKRGETTQPGHWTLREKHRSFPYARTHVCARLIEDASTAALLISRTRRRSQSRAARPRGAPRDTTPTRRRLRARRDGAVQRHTGQHGCYEGVQPAQQGGDGSSSVDRARVGDTARLLGGALVVPQARFGPLSSGPMSGRHAVRAA